MHDLNLLLVEKPARYMGGEMGAVKKEGVDLRFVLAFPDVYEVGMSHLGLQILYGALNGVDWIAAERVYAPWPDMEDILRREGKALATLESGAVIQVPLFINEGDRLKVDTRTGSYIERLK